jgi:acyl-CoA synthetase (AMP-forming)/AMP-acid ligase II
MLGLMQRRELLISSILEHAARHHAKGEIVSRRDDGTILRSSYADLADRSLRLAGLLKALDVGTGDRVATLAMNSDRHLQLYYAIAGIGAVCNTINPRLAPADIAYIALHAGDGLIFVDPCFLPIVEQIAPSMVGQVRAVIVLTDQATMPTAVLPDAIPLLCFETLMQAATPLDAWPSFDENSAAGLCYTSGTTGKPKGVLYSHRSTVLLALSMNGADVAGLRATDRMMPVVPMFHVNAWGFPFAAPMAGAALILPGRHLDPATLLALANHERVNIAAAVPTVWFGLLNLMREQGNRLDTLKHIISGGAAVPRAMIADYQALGIRVTQACGMTETSPITTWNSPKPGFDRLDAETQLDKRASQGRVLFGVELRSEGEDRQPVPWDGVSQGNLLFRGNWVASAYYRMPESTVGSEGWFATGDVGVVDADGFVQLTDRTKDLIKSGGEWISSIALENIAIGHPELLEAAAIAVPDAKWGERPLLIAVARPGCCPTPESVRSFYKGKLPDWSIPDRVIFADSLPHGATGKLLKSELRRLYATGA